MCVVLAFFIHTAAYFNSIYCYIIQHATVVFRLFDRKNSIEFCSCVFFFYRQKTVMFFLNVPRYRTPCVLLLRRKNMPMTEYIEEDCDESYELPSIEDIQYQFGGWARWNSRFNLIKCHIHWIVMHVICVEWDHNWYCSISMTYKSELGPNIKRIQCTLSSNTITIKLIDIRCMRCAPTYSLFIWQLSRTSNDRESAIKCSRGSVLFIRNIFRYM